MQTKEEIKKLHKIKDLTLTEGGKELATLQKELVINQVAELSNSYQTKTHAELIALCARLSANLGLLQILTGVDEQIKAIEKLYEEEDKENN